MKITLANRALGSLALALALFPSAVSAAVMARVACDDHYFTTIFPLLVQDEKAVGEAFNKMAAGTGSTYVTNCTIDYPEENGVAVHGPRWLSFDRRWDRIVRSDGGERRVPQQAGMEVEYNVRRGLTGNIHEVVSLVVCRTPESCQRRGIPRSAVRRLPNRDRDRDFVNPET